MVQDRQARAVRPRAFSFFSGGRVLSRQDRSTPPTVPPSPSSPRSRRREYSFRFVTLLTGRMAVDERGEELSLCNEWMGGSNG